MKKALLVFCAETPRGLLEPLSITSIAGFLRQREISVDLLSSLHLPDTVNSLYSILERMDFSSYSIVGVSSPFPPYEAAIGAAERVRRNFQGPICVGGHGCTLYPELFLRTNSPIDYAVIGDGEEPMLDLVEAASSDRDLASIENVAYLQDGRVVVNPPRQPRQDLDYFGFSARDLLSGMVREFGPDWCSAPMTVSRGCVHNCRFCSTAKFLRLQPKPYTRVRSISSVRAEMEEVVSSLGVTSFHFEDDNFLLLFGGHRHEKVDEFVDAIEGLDTDITFSAGFRPDSIDGAVLRKLTRVGLDQMFVSIEATNDEDLAYYGKAYTWQQAVAGLRACIEAGFSPAVGSRKRVSIGMMLFNPRSTLEKLRAGYDFIAAHHLPVKKLLSRVRAYPGTPFWHELAAEDLLVDDGGYRFSDPEVGIFHEMATGLAHEVWKTRDRIRDVEKFAQFREIEPGRLRGLPEIRHHLDVWLFRQLRRLLDEDVSEINADDSRRWRDTRSSQFLRICRDMKIESTMSDVSTGIEFDEELTRLLDFD